MIAAGFLYVCMYICVYVSMYLCMFVTAHFNRVTFTVLCLKVKAHECCFCWPGTSVLWAEEVR